MLFEKYERLDDKKEWAFKELTDALNMMFRKAFREFNNSSGSRYLVESWRVGLIRPAYEQTMPNGRVFSVRRDCKLVIIVREILDRDNRRYDIDDPILDRENEKKLQIELTDYIHRELSRAIRYRYISFELHLFDFPDYPAKYAEAISLSFFISLREIVIFLF